MTARRLVAARPQMVDQLDLEGLERGVIHRIQVNVITNALGVRAWVPVLVARGSEEGPVLAVTAAIHGNELNGIKIVQRLLASLDPRKLHGTVIGVPVMNVPGYRNNTREFNDGQDLNRVMPGDERGDRAQVYAHRLMHRIVDRAAYLVDLHTASAGRINAIYVRADMTDPVTARMARLQQAQIIVHNSPGDATLRGAAAHHGIHAITIEVGDPERFQSGKIGNCLAGIENLLLDLGMLTGSEPVVHGEIIECSRSYWIYTDAGGVLEVFPRVASHIAAGAPIARLYDIFGDHLSYYHAPEDGVAVGKSNNPVSRTGSRVLHLGIVGPVTAGDPGKTA